MAKMKKGIVIAVAILVAIVLLIGIVLLCVYQSMWSRNEIAISNDQGDVFSLGTYRTSRYTYSDESTTTDSLSQDSVIIFAIYDEDSFLQSVQEHDCFVEITSAGYIFQQDGYQYKLANMGSSYLLNLKGMGNHYMLTCLGEITNL